VSPLRLGDNEPAAGPWRVMPLAELAALLLETAGERDGRPAIVVVDGRSSSGKTTLAGRLERTVAGTSVVHTDDIAWWHSRFGWGDLLERGVLEPARRGDALAYRPPAWDERNRPGAIEVPAGARLLIVEGVGAGRRETAHLVDAIVYVQADLDEAERRTAARVAASETDADAVRGWMAEEDPFVADQRPWERADAIVAGTPDVAFDPVTEVVAAWRAGWRRAFPGVREGDRP
jgi:hypothetical protein